MGLMVLEVFLQAAVLCTILFVVAKHEADYSFQKVAMVVAGIVLGNMIIQGVLHERIPARLEWLVAVPCVAFTAFMIMTFCWINIWKSLLVVLVFVGFQFLAHLGIEALKRHYGPSEEQAVAIQKKQAEIAETQQQIVAMMEEQAARPVEKPPKEPAKEPAKKAAKKAAPVPQAPAEDEAGWKEAEKRLKIAGISSRQGQRIALVNNGVVAENDTVRVRHDDKIYTWRAVSIGDDGVRWKRLTARPVKTPAPRTSRR